jgi:hypothetical protein
MSVTLNGSNGITFNDGSSQTAAASPFGLKNRIINGDCRIDQRNAGASVASPSDTYTLDRFYSRQVGGGVASIQQSSTAPNGFNNSLLFTVTTADSSIVTTDRYYIRQYIEGYNVADLGWGTASAQTITLSFWVRSSVTGTFGGSLQNDAVDRTYAFTYTVSSANTWEQKSITIAGDTSGTWLKTNGIGLIVQWSLGMGPTYLTTAGSWTAGNYLSATGSTNLIATNGATFYITGVQLEVGSTATPFERRMYGQELALCQRYYWMMVKQTTATIIALANMSYYNNTYLGGNITLPVTMRTAPSLDAASGTNYYIMFRNNGNNTVNSWSIVDSQPQVVNIYNTAQASGTAGQAGWSNTNASGAYVAFNAEL